MHISVAVQRQNAAYVLSTYHGEAAAGELGVTVACCYIIVMLPLVM